MANLIVIFVTDVSRRDGTDQVNVSMAIDLQDSGGLSSWSASVLIDLKVLGLYKTEPQLNNEIVNEAVSFVNSQGHVESIPKKYLIGGFNNTL